MSDDLPSDNRQAAGQLLQWALQPDRRPAGHREYRTLVERYLDDGAFRTATDEFARGLGLEVEAVSTKGVALVPRAGSPFCMTESSYRHNYRGADQRLLDGLALFAVVATIYPKAADLERDRQEAPRPTTVDEIEDTLRTLAEQWEERAQEEGHPDPMVEELEQGLEEAWRVYEQRVSADKSESSKASSRTTRAHIEHALEVLEAQGLMSADARTSPTRYQPTWTFQVLIQEQGAERMFRALRDAQSGPADTPEPSTPENATPEN